MRRRPWGDDESGFTLVELLVVVFILAIVGSITTTGVVSAFRANAHAETRIQALTAMQSTVANVLRDLRAADSRETSGAALLTATPTQLRFDTFRNGTRIRSTFQVTAAGTITERREVWSSQALSAVSGPRQSDTVRTIVRDLTGFAAAPVFSYRDIAGTCVSGCAGNLTTAVTAAGLPGVAEVAIRLSRPMGNGRPTLDLVTRVALRNL